MSADLGPYGRRPRRALDGYAPLPYERHLRDYGRRHYDEYLVEEYEDGTVLLLPSDALACPGRTIWRRISRTATP